ncbi:MAG: esterase family protein [Candidatus Azobacteroides sp.]|nr:esterase family protein [Candidatus Azobacteroides sp.]
MKKIIYTLILSTCSLFALHAAKVDTILTRSTVMDESIKAVVVLPDTYDGQKEYPVVYTLHGYSGNYAGWVNFANYKDLADQHQVILVSPDGKNSWYWDSPLNPKSQYETYVGKELVQQIDQLYKTIKSPKGRAITGLSMGGHGALYLAIRHQDTFGAAGSMSGGVDIRPFPENWEMKNALGSYEENKELWEKNTVINMLDQIQPGALALIIDCGVDDFFYQVNVNLHNALLERNIPHDFISRPGGHTGEYWTNAIKYQVLFMSLFFQGYQQ